MISVSTGSYPTLMRAAEQQAARMGLAQNAKQFVPVQVQELVQTANSAKTGTSAGSQGRIVDIAV